MYSGLRMRVFLSVPTLLFRSLEGPPCGIDLRVKIIGMGNS